MIKSNVRTIKSNIFRVAGNLPRHQPRLGLSNEMVTFETDKAVNFLIKQNCFGCSSFRSYLYSSYHFNVIMKGAGVS